MVTNKKTGNTVKANKMTDEAVKSNKKTGQTLKLKPEAKRSTKKLSLEVNKVAKTPTDKTNKSKPSATRPIKEPIARKMIPIREATQSSLQGTHHLQPQA
jgi:hypothetical protein